ncbi:UDP-6-deoxy-AltdiNAc hydrolase [Hydrogenimonas sp.]|nr:UDP-6-deoxy-AltdiNAc hydrolase [Hydrogenimonas sp.]
MKRVVVRADSSSTIGTGHIMRDLVLAKRDFCDSEVIFAVRNLPGNINHKIDEAGYEKILLHSDGIEEFIETIRPLNPETVVFDHYGIGHRDEQRVKEATGATIFVLDDTYEKHHCDILLNHNVYADPSRYKELVPATCELRCGSKFTLLREEFIEAKKKKTCRATHPLRHPKLKVFIAMGGADTSNLNIPILDAVKEQTDIHAHIVTTRANKNLEELKSYARAHEHVTLHIETSEIATLMSESDFAVVSPSVTVNEVIFMQLPFIAIKTADNQNEMCSYLKERGEALLEKFDEEGLKIELKNMVDFLQTELVNFTQLTKKQKLDLLEWRNNPKVRQWMLNKEPIAPADHLAFIDSLQKREDRVYFLVNLDERPIGVIDFTQIDKSERSAHIGLYANPSTYGMGRLLMQKILEFGYGFLGLETLFAEVYKKNEKAINLYKRFGFKPTETIKADNRGLLTMERKK